MVATLKPRIARTPMAARTPDIAVKKTVSVPAANVRHKQLDSEKRNTFPKRPKRGTRPFATTMDF